MCIRDRANAIQGGATVRGSSWWRLEAEPGVEEGKRGATGQEGRVVKRVNAIQGGARARRSSW
eukprot:9496849-Pyramimonas_sp.AAC.1